MKGIGNTFFHFQVDIPWTSPDYANNLTITIQPPVSTQYLKISPRGPLSGNGSCLKIDILDSMACKSSGQCMSVMILPSCNVKKKNKKTKKTKKTKKQKKKKKTRKGASITVKVQQ